MCATKNRPLELPRPAELALKKKRPDFFSHPRLKSLIAALIFAGECRSKYEKKNVGVNMEKKNASSVFSI